MSATTCSVCASPNPTWRITRKGDGLVNWGCNQDLDYLLTVLQGPTGVTELIVVAAKGWTK